jgi:hypothetical protein
MERFFLSKGKNWPAAIGTLYTRAERMVKANLREFRVEVNLPARRAVVRLAATAKLTGRRRLRANRPGARS